MTPREPLPDELSGAGFDRVRARDAGLPADRLRRRSLHRPFHGVYASTPPRTLVDRCHAYGARLKPGQFFSHTTALVLHGIPLPAGFEDEAEVHVAALLPADAPHSRGVRGHRLQAALPVVTIDGLAVADPLDAFCQVGGLLALEDLTIVVDELLNRGSEDETAAKAAMLEQIAAMRRLGAPQLVRAVRLGRRGSRSPAETRVRLVLEAGRIPSPELNAPIVHSTTGRYLGSPDFVWRRQRVVLEYEGDGHRIDRGQFRYDIRRYDDLAADGWRVLRATGDDLTSAGRPLLVARVRRALEQA